MMGGAPDSASRKRGRGPDDAGLGRECSADRPAKHVKRAHAPCDAAVKHALLVHYYSEIQTLRQYALAKLPPSSRIRRRKIASLGLDKSKASPEKPSTEDELALGHLLDSTIVARRHHAGAEAEAEADKDYEHRWEQWVGFSQRGDESYVTLSDGLKGSIFSQSEVRRNSDQFR